MSSCIQTQPNVSNSSTYHMYHMCNPPFEHRTLAFHPSYYPLSAKLGHTSSLTSIDLASSASTVLPGASAVFWAGWAT